MHRARSSPTRARALVLILVAACVLPGARGAIHYSIPPSGMHVDGVTIPVTFSRGLVGSTTLGANATYAETDVPDVSTLLTDTWLIDVESRTWRAQSTFIRLADVTGLPRVVEAKITLGTTTQVHIRNGEVLTSEGSALPLASGTTLAAGGDLQVDKGQNAHLTLDVVSRDARGITLVETWVLVLRG